MKKEKEDELRALNEQYEVLWASVNAPESQLSTGERKELNEKLEGLLQSIRNIKTE
jgi:hypothetical protein